MRKLATPSYVEYLNTLANTDQDGLEEFSRYLMENTARQYFLKRV